MDNLENQLRKIFADKLPGLPDNIKEYVAKFLPWILIVFGCIGLLAWLSAIGLFGYASMVTYGWAHGSGRIMSMFSLLVLYLLAPIMQVLSITGGYLMLSRRLSGWRIAFYSVLVSFVIHLLYFSLFGFFWDFLFVYLLFQIRGYYHA
jgi:hypothetical protein